MIVTRKCASGAGVVRSGRQLAAVALAVSALLSSAAVHASGQVVGEVSLLIGSARVVHKNGVSESLRRGSPIAVGDRVETTGNGHVHVRFIDNAAVSIRPDSALEVQAYRYDANNPQLSEVRLSVGQGMSRSISGQATDADKGRFRLNTPLAAIGVRGTDFLVQTTDTGVRASVADGAIVVGALGGNCSASTLGPCSGARSKLLSADMGRLMVEVRRGDDVARVVPIAGALLAAATASEERLSAQRAAEAVARHGGMAAGEQVFTNNDRAAAGLLTVAEAAVPPRNSEPDANAQLVWGRYSLREPFNDKVSVPYVKAVGDRHWTVGDNDYTLFRSNDPSNPSNRLMARDEGPVDFRLSRAQATFQDLSTGRVEAAVVSSGTLTLDFSRQTFATLLPLSSPTAGSTELRVAGVVEPNGTFKVRDLKTNEYVTGAVSLDGKEVGYLFERGVGNGLFKGKTLWGR